MQNSAAASPIHWLDPRTIQFKIVSSAGLSGCVGGDWDLVQRRPLMDGAKYRAVVEHFAEGRPWIETDLFRDAYARRLAAGERLRGVATLGELAALYERQIDGLFAAMRAQGFRAVGGLPRLLRGRDGDIHIGNQGNHRLAMAHLLGLDRFAGVIACTHP